MPADLLEWDTAFFGFPIARVRGNTLSAESARQIEAWCADRSVRCVYLLCDAGDAATIRAAEDDGYRPADVRLTFRWETAAGFPESVAPARPAQPADIPALEAISRECYQETRFYNDPGFPREKVVALYETWIRRSVEGWADAVLVTEDRKGPAGYVTCHRDGWRIGLVGVSARARGQGAGRTLVGGALEWFRDAGAPEVFVPTQGANLAAQRLYRRCGFATRSVQLWFHKWRLL